MKTAIILPGWEQDPTETRYTNIEEFFKHAGFKTLLHNPMWELHDASKWVDELSQNIPKTVGELTLIGFSMGAMISLIAASRLHVENLILCSPSGYFKEYVPFMTADDLRWAKENVQGFDEISSMDIISRVNVKRGYVLAGDEELAMWPDFKQWVHDLCKQTH